MSRFWINLQEGVYFVRKNFERMQGGEIFIPKIPSMTMADMASAVFPSMKQNVVGLRPGEKMHEAMCAEGDSHLTLEFDDHFVIQPSIQFTHTVSFITNGLGETGKPVKLGFDYNSRDNTIWLSAEQLLEKIQLTELEEK